MRNKDLAVLRAACRQFPAVREVRVFGSRATGTASRASDLDLAISAPDATAASMNSRRRMLKVWPRTMRAIVSHPTAPIARNKKYWLRPKITVRKMTKKISGRPLNTSMNRIIK